LVYRWFDGNVYQYSIPCTDGRAFSIDRVGENTHERQEPSKPVFYALLMICSERLSSLSD
jgi:hypothetical protein